MAFYQKAGQAQLLRLYPLTSSKNVCHKTNVSGSFYIGLHKLHDQTTWKWIDRNAVQGVSSGRPNNADAFSDWAVGEGANTFENHCLALYRKALADPLEWYQRSCRYNYRYVCEVSPTFPRHR